MLPSLARLKVNDATPKNSSIDANPGEKRPGGDEDAPKRDDSQAQRQRLTDASRDLLKAAGKNDLEAVKEAIRRGADVNARDENDNTPLMLACDYFRNSKDIALELLNHEDINVNLVNTDKRTALHFAVDWSKNANTKIDVMKQLIDKGADINAVDDEGLTPFLAACQYGDTDVELWLFNRPEMDLYVKVNDKDTVLDRMIWDCHGGDAIFNRLKSLNVDPNPVNEYGNTPLIEACANEYSDQALFLLSFDNIDVNHVGKAGQTALYYAAFYEMEDVLNLLIDKGANNVNVVNTLEGNTPLLIALSQSPSVVLKLLSIPGIDVNMGDGAALYRAAKEGYLDVVKRLKELNANPNLRDENGNTLLIDMYQQKKTDVADILLTFDNIDVDFENKENKTALHWASQNGMLEIVQKLIEKGADVNKQKDDEDYNDTPLTLACQYKHTDVARELLKHKDVIEVLWDDDVRTALHWAAENGMVDIIDDLVKEDDFFNIQDGNDDTALILACKNKHPAVAFKLFVMIKDLAKYREDGGHYNKDGFNSANKFGYTALHWASKNGMDKVVKKLIKLDAKVNMRNEDGDTPLILACEGAHENVALALLDVYRINVNAGNKDRETALYWASRNGMDEVVERLGWKDAIETPTIAYSDEEEDEEEEDE